MILVKLGGSVITDKSKLKTARPAVISRLAKEIATVKDELILVHGAGSYGHVKAEKYRLNEGHFENSQLDGIGEVQRDVRELNLKVLNALLSAGMRPVSVPPGIVVHLSGGRIAKMDSGPFRDYLALEMTPVTFGDVTIDSERRFGIVSGDDLMLELSRIFTPLNSLFVTDVDGVYTRDPKSSGGGEILKEISKADIGKVDLSSRRAKDVTGGLEGKLFKMFEAAEFSDESWILNGLVPGRLKDALAGKKFIGTKVVA